jgi:hypothetical protein
MNGMMGGESRMRTGSVRAALLITLGVFAAWVTLWGVIWYLSTGRERFRSRYARVEIGPQNEAWLEFRSRRVRVAASLADLREARWQGSEGISWEDVKLPAVALPLGEARPQGWDRVELVAHRGENVSGLEWRLTKRDQRGREWTYVSQSMGLEDAKSPEKARPIAIPRIAGATLQVSGREDREEGKPKVTVYLRLQAGDLVLSDVEREGASVKAQVRVLDDGGKLIASTAGPLEDFGLT